MYQRVKLVNIDKMEDEKFLKLEIQRFEQKIFALALWLIGGDKNKAYNIAVDSFAEALRLYSVSETEGVLLTNLTSATIRRSQGVEVMPSFDESDFMDLPAGKRKSLSLVASALHLLPFEIKALLLLRVQLHLPYKIIADVIKISESDVRSQMGQANIKFREKIEEVMLGGG